MTIAYSLASLTAEVYVVAAESLSIVSQHDALKSLR